MLIEGQKPPGIISDHWNQAIRGIDSEFFDNEGVSPPPAGTIASPPKAGKFPFVQGDDDGESEFFAAASLISLIASTRAPTSMIQ